jgi:hypothetical protein
MTQELRNARAALDQERKLRKVQTDTIKVSPLNNFFYPLRYFILSLFLFKTTPLPETWVIVNFPEEGCEESSVPDP